MFSNMDVVFIVLFSLGAIVFAFWAEFRLEIAERRFRSREEHPAGKTCPDCHVRPDDMEIHRRLAHSPRVRAPEDSW